VLVVAMRPAPARRRWARKAVAVTNPTMPSAAQTSSPTAGQRLILSVLAAHGAQDRLRLLVAEDHPHRYVPRPRLVQRADVRGDERGGQRQGADQEGRGARQPVAQLFPLRLLVHDASLGWRFVLVVPFSRPAFRLVPGWWHGS
jgi:hypothetical protein